MQTLAHAWASHNGESASTCCYITLMHATVWQTLLGILSLIFGRRTAPLMSQFSPSPIYDSHSSASYQRQRQLTLGDLLLENRIVFLQGEIFSGNANDLVMKLLYLQSENRRKDIHFYLNSPGGDVAATLAVYDTMQILSCPVATYCVGQAASGATEASECTQVDALEIRRVFFQVLGRTPGPHSDSSFTPTSQGCKRCNL